jgi:hypothetical protein
MVSIDMLPDDVLLEIFDFYVNEEVQEAWQLLVHVCRRWRSVVFRSPNRLKLELVCTARTPARDTLDIWPALPLLILDKPYLEGDLDNIIAVLKCSGRVRIIHLKRTARVPSSDLEKLLAGIQAPFPELTSLRLNSDGEVVLPDSFLGGSAPRLQILELDGISFPGSQKQLLSATHLHTLHLQNVPHSGYISPEAMFTVLSTLTSLEQLVLEFKSPLSRPDQATRRPPPPTRSVHPVLTYFQFKGDSEYLEDLVAHIDAPQLDELKLFFFNQIVFDTPQFIQFVCRIPRLKPLEKARVTFDGDAAMVGLSSQESSYECLHVKISCRELDWQVSSLEQVCTSSLPPLSTLEDLYINEGTSPRAHWKDNIENVLWLELLHPFRAVKNLYLSKEFALRIVPALQELVGDSATEVLPTLQNIFLEGLRSSGPIQRGIGKFVTTRQITSHPIVVARWDRNRVKFL